ncbi:MAG: hypothetical protein KF767_16345 [Bdellovibrionaceae bacterium]|nr:hypothetical protein [Pseudobdellovibrionaceae bacterium]
MNAKTFTMISLLALALLSTACAPKEFSAASEGELGLKNLGSETTGGDGEGELPATGTNTPDPTDPTDPSTPVTPVIYPQITMKIPTCTSHQNCQVRVVLSRVDGKTVSYRWKTNDTKYTQDPGRYAQPGVHYVATGGTVTFNAGSTLQYKYIQTLSGFTQIDIPFLYGECTYDNRPVDCSVYKFKLERI